ncbi:hypothetical protein CIB84_010556, partial [Bambusicola thoracicus]
SSVCAVLYRYAYVLACVYVATHRHVFSQVSKARRNLFCSSFVANALQSRRAVCTAWISAHRSPSVCLISYSKSQTASESISSPRAKSCLCITGCAVTSPLGKMQFLTHWDSSSPRL